MAEMGNRTLKELDRVCTSVKDDEQRRPLHSHLQAQDESIQDPALPVPSAPTHTEAALAIPHDFDIHYFSDLAGLDPFELFDPNFNLEGIDSFLASNLDPAASM
ncbi:hypothetical protein E8E13_000732 [Curvularia kusanoi]|uniref:Uncharacterized protein n=1 Tax=Curvularia kusanoi TaxID=90978 RepID=A0A9P4W5W3_CURKU|nr:hypothetical protein E8E13_000732 [Curvularia kusanoi]